MATRAGLVPVSGPILCILVLSHSYLLTRREVSSKIVPHMEVALERLKRLVFHNGMLEQRSGPQAFFYLMYPTMPALKEHKSWKEREDIIIRRGEQITVLIKFAPEQP
jgi:hypothetical protein